MFGLKMPLHAPKQWANKIPTLSLGARGLPSNTAMPPPTPLTTPNSIRIHSAVLPQNTFRTDRQTDRLTDGPGEKPVLRVLTLESDALIIIRLIFLDQSRHLGVI